MSVQFCTDESVSRSRLAPWLSYKITARGSLTSGVGFLRAARLNCRQYRRFGFGCLSNFAQSLKKEWRKKGIHRRPRARYLLYMPETFPGFDNKLAHDADGTVRIESICKECGDSRTVSIRDGSLKRWESHHTCSNHTSNPSSDI
jgi:serine/threonine protein phosphatase PrpC